MTAIGMLTVSYTNPAIRLASTLVIIAAIVVHVLIGGHLPSPLVHAVAALMLWLIAGACVFHFTQERCEARWSWYSVATAPVWLGPLRGALVFVLFLEAIEWLSGRLIGGPLLDGAAIVAAVWIAVSQVADLLESDDKPRTHSSGHGPGDFAPECPRRADTSEIGPRNDRWPTVGRSPL